MISVCSYIVPSWSSSFSILLRILFITMHSCRYSSCVILRPHVSFKITNRRSPHCVGVIISLSLIPIISQKSSYSVAVCGFFSPMFSRIFPLISVRLCSVHSMSDTAFHRKSQDFYHTDNRCRTADAQSAVFRFCGVHSSSGS